MQAEVESRSACRECLGSVATVGNSAPINASTVIDGGAMMAPVICVFAVILTGLALAPALAHAFEFPGKRRLDRNAYIRIQGIYYPGFTFLGISEPAALFATVAMLLTERQNEVSFWLTLLALIGLAGMQIIYWLVTHPTNRIWLRDSSTSTGKAGEAFFAVGLFSKATAGGWKALRDRWEYSHIARATLAFFSFAALVTAMAVMR